jgi:hypothetical protein
MTPDDVHRAEAQLDRRDNLTRARDKLLVADQNWLLWVQCQPYTPPEIPSVADDRWWLSIRATPKLVLRLVELELLDAEAQLKELSVA